MTSSAALKDVFVELGGERKIEEILRSFYTKMSKDVLLGFFFTGKNLEKIILGQKAFLLRAMGAKSVESASYEGPSPKEAHRKMPPILEGHFDRRLVLLRET